MKGVIIFYKLGKHTSKKKEKVLRELWGKKQQSYYGKYSYDFEGILAGIPHIKPARSAVIVKGIDKHKVTSFLDKNKVPHVVFNTNIGKELLNSRSIYY